MNTEKDPQANAREREAVLYALRDVLLSLAACKASRRALPVTPLEDRPLLDRFSWN